eukprot:scaffold4251_cov37-Cyclotella_meneghiniana.AAC.4
MSADHSTMANSLQLAVQTLSNPTTTITNVFATGAYNHHQAATRTDDGTRRRIASECNNKAKRGLKIAQNQHNNQLGCRKGACGVGDNK